MAFDPSLAVKDLDPWQSTNQEMKNDPPASRNVSVSSILVTMVSISLGAERQYRHGDVVPGVPDRYCLQGRIWGYPGNCQFATYEQCLATASGTDAYCGINPTYAFAHQRDYQGQWHPR